MSNITIHQAQLTDIEAISPIFDMYRQFYGRTSDISAANEFLKARFNKDESTIFVATENEVCVGFAQLYPSFSSVSLARTFILNDLFVCEFARKKGVASKLISSAVEFARTSGANRMTLTTAIENQKAQELYISSGWKRDEQFFVYHFTL
jgi:GNAT superfamily N-acetyltransferase